MKRSENITIIRPKRCQACGLEIRRIAARYLATEAGEDFVRSYWHPACADALDAARAASGQTNRHVAGVERSSPRRT